MNMLIFHQFIPFRVYNKKVKRFFCSSFLGKPLCGPTNKRETEKKLFEAQKKVLEKRMTTKLERGGVRGYCLSGRTTSGGTFLAAHLTNIGS